MAGTICPPVKYAGRQHAQQRLKCKKWASELKINAQAPNEFMHGHPITSCPNAYWRHTPAPEHSTPEEEQGIHMQVIHGGFQATQVCSCDTGWGDTATQELPCAGHTFP